MKEMLKWAKTRRFLSWKKIQAMPVLPSKCPRAVFARPLFGNKKAVLFFLLFANRVLIRCGLGEISWVEDSHGWCAYFVALPSFC
jgi:hypothetical protein